MSSPKNFATFVRKKSFDKYLDKRRSKINKMSTKKSPKFCCLFPNRHPLSQEKYKISCSITTNSPSPTRHKLTHLLITRKPPVNSSNCSYATAHGIWNFVTNQVFENSSQIIFVINWMSRCKQESLTFAENWRSFLRISFKTRIFKNTANNLNIYWSTVIRNANFLFLMTMTEDNNLSFTEKSC